MDGSSTLLRCDACYHSCRLQTVLIQVATIFRGTYMLITHIINHCFITHGISLAVFAIPWIADAGKHLNLGASPAESTDHLMRASCVAARVIW